MSFSLAICRDKMSFSDIRIETGPEFTGLMFWPSTIRVIDSLAKES